MVSCKDVARLISQSMDAALPLGKRIAVRLHLLTCRFCRRYARQFRLIRETIRHLAAAHDHPEAPAGETLSPEARGRIRKFLRGA